MRRHRDLLEILRANGMRITAGRRSLLQFILDKQARGVRLREIYEHLDQRRQHVDRTSVYRNLIAFERLGIVQALKLPQRGITYQYVLDRKIHHFYICKACGRARRGNRKLFDRIEAALRDTHGFAKANLSVVFYGTCENCVRAAQPVTRKSSASVR
jgi:Fur family ferric uptake transcriptional regulator